MVFSEVFALKKNAKYHCVLTTYSVSGDFRPYKVLL